jgi:hypothetical protein
MGSVEWVTLQVRVSQAVEGAWKTEEVVVDGVEDLFCMYLEGVRRVMVVGGAPAVVAASVVAGAAAAASVMMAVVLTVKIGALVCKRSWQWVILGKQE